MSIDTKFQSCEYTPRSPRQTNAKQCAKAPQIIVKRYAVRYANHTPSTRRDERLLLDYHLRLRTIQEHKFKPAHINYKSGSQKVNENQQEGLVEVVRHIQLFEAKNSRGTVALSLFGATQQMEVGNKTPSLVVTPMGEKFNFCHFLAKEKQLQKKNFPGEC